LAEKASFAADPPLTRRVRSRYLAPFTTTRSRREKMSLAPANSTAVDQAKGAAFAGRLISVLATNVARACRAGLAGFSLVIVSASFVAADFGPRTAIGANYQQWSSTTSENGLTQGTCSGSLGCFVLFQPVPQQKSLIVQHLSCRASVNAGGLRFGSLLTRKGIIFVDRRTLLVPVGTTGNDSVVNTPVMHLFKSGERPQVFLSNTQIADWFAECSISGKLQQP
jgi:hypothetical protein